MIPCMNDENEPGEKLFDLTQLEEMDDYEYVAEILTAIFASMPRDLAALQKACDSDDFSAINKMAHILKGSASVIHANVLIRFLQKMDEFSRTRIHDGLTVLANQVIEAYGEIENPLKEYLKNISTGNNISI